MPTPVNYLLDIMIASILLRWTFQIGTLHELPIIFCVALVGVLHDGVTVHSRPRSPKPAHC